MKYFHKKKSGFSDKLVLCRCYFCVYEQLIFKFEMIFFFGVNVLLNDCSFKVGVDSTVSRYEAM